MRISQICEAKGQKGRMPAGNTVLAMISCSMLSLSLSSSNACSLKHQKLLLFRWAQRNRELQKNNDNTVSTICPSQMQGFFLTLNILFRFSLSLSSIWRDKQQTLSGVKGTASWWPAKKKKKRRSIKEKLCFKAQLRVQSG